MTDSNSNQQLKEQAEQLLTQEIDNNTIVPYDTTVTLLYELSTNSNDNDYNNDNVLAYNQHNIMSLDNNLQQQDNNKIYITSEEFNAIQLLKDDYDKLQNQYNILKQQYHTEINVNNNNNNTVNNNDNNINDLQEENNTLYAQLEYIQTLLTDEIKQHNQLKLNYTNIINDNNNLNNTINNVNNKNNQLFNEINILNDLIHVQKERIAQYENNINQLNNNMNILQNNNNNNDNIVLNSSNNQSIELTIALKTIEKLENELQLVNNKYKQSNELYNKQQDSIKTLEQSINKLLLQQQHDNNNNATNYTINNIQQTNDELIENNKLKLNYVLTKNKLTSLLQYNQYYMFEIYSKLLIICSVSMIVCITLAHIF